MRVLRASLEAVEPFHPPRRLAGLDFDERAFYYTYVQSVLSQDVWRKIPRRPRKATLKPLPEGSCETLLPPLVTIKFFRGRRERKNF